MSQFQELERTVYNSMYTLVRDTVVLRDYTHSTLVIIQVKSVAGILLSPFLASLLLADMCTIVQRKCKMLRKFQLSYCGIPFNTPPILPTQTHRVNLCDITFLHAELL